MKTAKESRQLAKTLFMRKARHNLRQELLSLLGNKCSICGFNDWRALQIDHINGGGRQEHLKHRNTYYYMVYVKRKILNGSKDYRLLCANCNWIERYKRGLCGYKE